MQLAIVALYLVTLAILGLYGFHRGHLLMLYLKHRARRDAPPQRFAEDALPHVTVQLPMFNEMYVAERLLDGVAAIDYPRDRLEIQVLDDSTDETREIAQRKVAELAAQGLDVAYLHRTDRTGYKAGALAAGTRVAKGELLMVFDADFVPTPPIVRQLVHHFTDPTVGMVQARWGHLNRGYSTLTACQSMMLDGHFTIEHIARSSRGGASSTSRTRSRQRRSPAR